MPSPELSFFQRLSLAFSVFSRVLADPIVARKARDLLGPEGAAQRPAAPVFSAPPPDSALQLLGLLQQEGRFVDFLQEDISSFPDSEVGAAARVVHEGCRKVLKEHLEIVPVRQEDEGSRIQLAQGFDASSVRLTGNVVGSPPFAGSLIHRGWRVAEVHLPRVAEGHDTRILAPAEVEL